ncbi:MAG TPA: histidine--tRNA ligase [Acidimicrobiia bacterium]|nr:histidine--tRNA ligase [Acidimicrobiia bacterium]
MQEGPAPEGKPQPSADAYRAPVGTHDVLPPESGRWAALVAKFAARATRFGYGLVMTPAYEHIEVFQRVGEGTDVVRKEMYEFEDKGGRRLALRPEGTAPVVRAYIQHRPTPPWKVWYLSPHFRHEKAQRGRYRQHHQLGVEAIGVDDPALDVEVISLAQGFFTSVGLTRFRLAINSLGDGQCRPGYLEALRSYLRAHADELCEDSRSRLEANPLRVLDCKVPACVAVTERAPQLLEHLCADCKTHFEAVQAGLDAIGVTHEIEPRLVRGLDYYTRTTFEFASEALESAQNALGGGGRYDRLAEEMGGPPSPGIGFGIGIERVLIACDAEGVLSTPKPYLDAYVVDAVGPEAGAEVAALLAELRETGLFADRAYGGRSVKAQTKSADRAGARYVVLIGRAEMEKGAVAVRDMESGEQVEVPRSRVVGWLHDHIDPTHRDARR